MNKNLNIKRVGITGGIGSGKTESGKILENAGEKVLYADIIAKEVINSNEKVKNKIKQLFGQNYFDTDGKLNRKKLADLVFDDEESLMLLNSIVHPEVFKVIDDEIKKAKISGKKLIFIEAALIFESYVDEKLDFVIVIDAEENLCKERVCNRDKMSPAQFYKRVKSQIASEEKVKLGDFIIKNNSDILSLEKNILFIRDLIYSL
jgi:dephospho-CoA kinase